MVDILVNNAGLVTWKRELTEDGQCGDTYHNMSPAVRMRRPGAADADQPPGPLPADQPAAAPAEGLQAPSQGRQRVLRGTQESRTVIIRMIM